MPAAILVCPFSNLTKDQHCVKACLCVRLSQSIQIAPERDGSDKSLRPQNPSELLGGETSDSLIGV
jgi:hypothetical protein